MSKVEEKAILRREQDILDRIENVKRLIQMETTILTAHNAKEYAAYCMVDCNGKRIGYICDNLLGNLRAEIQLELLSIVALCYGDNPDIGEPMAMLEWQKNGEYEDHPEDRFRDVWEECLGWNI